MSNFEKGIESPQLNRKTHDAYTSYTKDAVMQYQVESIDQIIEDPNILVKLVKHHQEHQVPRLELLESYYLANNPSIMGGKRRQEESKSDHRIRHGWMAVISDFLNSHVLSNPIKIEADEAQEKFLELVKEFNQANDINAHNVELGKDQNNFGRAYEMLQRTQGDADKIYRLEPTQVFMIYDSTVRRRVIGACRYYPVNSWDTGTSPLHRVELYTFDKVIRYQPIQISIEEKLLLDTEEPHSFNGVPIIEYRADRYKMSVYERQLSLVDAYDAAQSDTANYMTDFNDAILAIEGRIENADDPTYLKAMKDANILVLVPEGDDLDGTGSRAIKAHYLTKSYDVAGAEAYKQRLLDDIFNTSSTPNLSDDSFAGQNASGVALEYKLFGLGQKKTDKEKFFAKGLRIRYKLLENLKREVSEYSGEAAELLFRFTPSLPKTYLEELKSFVEASGEISNKTKLGLLSFIEDATEEMDLLEEEKKVKNKGFDDNLGYGDTHVHQE